MSITSFFDVAIEGTRREGARVYRKPEVRSVGYAHRIICGAAGEYIELGLTGIDDLDCAEIFQDCLDQGLQGPKGLATLECVE